MKGMKKIRKSGSEIDQSQLKVSPCEDVTVSR